MTLSKFRRSDMSPQRLIMVVFGAVVALTACTGAMGVQPGDAVIPPELSAPELTVVVLAADDLVQIESVVVANESEVQPGPEGLPVLPWGGQPIDLAVTAPGFEPWEFTIEEYPEAGRIEFRLEPVVLRGVVTTDSGRPLPGTTVALGAARDTTDNEGRYALERAVPGVIELSRPAWENIDYPWDGEVSQVDMSMNPTIVHAVRVSPEDLLESERWDTILSLADVTGINAVAIDLKTEDGSVVYPTEVPVANAIGAVSGYFDAVEVVSEAKAHDLHTIARIGVFQDDFYAAAEPDRAVLSEDGSLWRSRNGFAWLDPSDPLAHDYSISLAEEACGRLGFDEVQFDYVSYPYGGDVTTAVFDGAYNQEVRVASVASFLSRAYSVLHPMGCTVSTTLLGIVLESTADEGVGQRPGTMSRIVDVLSPTLYSTNYGPGWKGFENPDNHAVEIVDTALAGGRGKLDGHGYLRPWIQTWTISNAEQRAVQSVVSENGMGWLLWSNSTSYTADALPRP
ncbi:MAG: putative glycoside hydrolase [Acidimicrobiia bacterium]